LSPRGEPAEELSRRLLDGERLALTRLMSGVEAGRPNARAALRCLYPRTGRAHVVGITGPPGSGKSTLTTRLAEAYRRRGATVGILAVDPTSPFTGGALLGDRIRMMDLHSDPGVFVRSMATRGVVGGLASTTGDMVVLLDAFGKDVILIETVGVGQDEVEIARTADTTLVVGVPGLGDDIQALKAGILEIADILVVNKADLDGAHRLVRELRMAQSLGEAQPWPVPIRETVATDGTGIPELVDQIQAHRAYLEQSGHWSERRAQNARRQIRAIVEDRVRRRFEALADADRWHDRFAAVAGRERDPYAVAQEMLDEVVRGDR
jgi:LAO/AO transport system kinase